MCKILQQHFFNRIKLCKHAFCNIHAQTTPTPISFILDNPTFLIYLIFIQNINLNLTFRYFKFLKMNPQKLILALGATVRDNAVFQFNRRCIKIDFFSSKRLSEKSYINEITKYPCMKLH